MPPLKEALRKIGACHNMEALTLSSMQIKDGDLEELLRAWKHMPLSRLNLADNRLSEKSIEDLLKSHCQFSEVNFSGNPLGPRCLEYLTPTFQSLEFLSLKKTNIGAQGVSVLAEDADRLRNLKHLDISDNGINTEGGPAIVRLLTQCKALKHFDVSSNSLRSALNEPMLSAITALTHLCYIDLRNNGFSSEQVDAFYDVVLALDRVLTGEMEIWISV
jgi:Ran GTPase-activating protein (RanGAP) involved in mRNA processing and transport